MRVFHINSYFTTNLLHGEFVASLDRAGIEQVVYIPVKSKGELNKNHPGVLGKGNLMYSHCFGPFSRFFWPLKMLQIWLDFEKKFRNNPGDIIHAHTLIVNGLIAYWANKKWGTPYVVTFRNTDINLFLSRYPFFRRIAWKVLDNASTVIALSPAYANIQLRRYFSETQYLSLQKKLKVIPNGINDFWLENRNKKEKHKKEPILLFVGRLDRNKNLDALIQAMEILTEKGHQFKLKVVGDGPLLDSFKEKACKFDIRFLGRINERAILIEEYRNADVLAGPSFKESFGLIYPEAMSQGLPVIYTKDQGFDGYFKNGEVGFAVSPDNIQEIKEKILEIINNYYVFAQRAYEGATLFSWQTISETLRSAYKSALKNSTLENCIHTSVL